MNQTRPSSSPLVALPATQKVAVLADSTAGLPASVAAAQGITVVQSSLVMNGTAVNDATTTSDDVLAALRRGQQVGTAAPTVEDFVAAYTDLGNHGVDEIVSVHVASHLSGTLDRAREAAARVRADGGPNVQVVDSLGTAMGLGWVALTAAGAAASGVSGAQVRDLAVGTAMRTVVLFTVKELDHLRRSGRIGGGQSAVGSVLGLRPVFRLQRGEITEAGRMRGSSRAIDRMVEVAQESMRGWPVHATVQHAGCAPEAADLVKALKASSMQIRGAVDVLDMPATITAQTGECFAVLVSPVDWS